MNCKETVLWMDAYIDGELELSRQLEVDQHLKSCAECAQRVEERRALQRSIQTAPLRFAMPAGLENRLRDVLEEPLEAEPETPAFNWKRIPMGTNWWGGFLSAATVTSALFLLAPAIARIPQDNRLAQDVMTSHVHALMTHHEIDVVTSNQHVVKPWFNGKVDFAPEVHDFSDHGFPLVGGRVDYLDHRSVAALFYHRALHPINVYTWPSRTNATTSIQSMLRNGYHLMHWSDNGMNYWIISDLNASELRDFAELVRSQDRS